MTIFYIRKYINIIIFKNIIYKNLTYNILVNFNNLIRKFKNT
jgi:hypothetical protein